MFFFIVWSCDLERVKTQCDVIFKHVAKYRPNQEDDPTHPERRRFALAQHDDADDHGRDAQEIEDPAIFQDEILIRFADDEQRDQTDLHHKSPNYKQSIRFV